MKRLLLAATLACATACFGQATSSSSGTQDQSAQAGSSEHKGHKAGGDTGGTKTVEGCIAEKDGQYWLKSAKGNYHLMGSQDFKSHVGHEVKATGTASMGPAPEAEQAATTGAANKPKQVHHLDVSSIDMVSEQCTAGKSKSSKKAPATSNPS